MEGWSDLVGGAALDPPRPPAAHEGRPSVPSDRAPSKSDARVGVGCPSERDPSERAPLLLLLLLLLLLVVVLLLLLLLLLLLVPLGTCTPLPGALLATTPSERAAHEGRPSVPSEES